MVGVLQGFDIGPFVNPARLMLWLTQLAERPIAIFSFESPCPRQSFLVDLLIDPKSDPSVSKVVQQLGFVGLP